MARELQELQVVGAAVLFRGRCLVARRGPGMSTPGKWEFPGGKVESGESQSAALEREIREELGIAIVAGEWLGRGEAIAGGRRIVLDVFAVDGETAFASELDLLEHSEVRWANASELVELDWAAPDIPVLPAVRACMLSDAAAQCASGDVAILAADWGKVPKKRAAYSALPSGTGWRIAREEAGLGGWSLARLTQRAVEIRDEYALPVFIGIDAALGFPEAYVRSTGRTGFIEALLWLAELGGLEDEWSEVQPGEPGPWRPDRPFFRVPRGRGALTRLTDTAGGRAMVMRQIERRVGANSVFALSGIPGTVGSGSRELYKELVPTLLDTGRPVRLWPFEGSLAELTAAGEVVLAEAYPRSAYAVALGGAPPFAPRSLAKTHAPQRNQAIEELAANRWLSAYGVELQELGREAGRANEDDFDAMMLAAGLLRACLQGLPLSSWLVDGRSEGGIAATGAVEISRRG